MPCQAHTTDPQYLFAAPGANYMVSTPKFKNNLDIMSSDLAPILTIVVAKK